MIFALCADFDGPLGGHKKIYRHVDVLNESGFDACVLHQKTDFRCSWFPNSTRIVYTDEVERIGAPDFLMVPEAFAAPAAKLPSGIPKVVFNQNCYYTFDFFTWDKNDTRTVYLSPELLAVLVVSEDSKAYFHHVFPHIPVYRLHNAIDESVFRFRAEKKRQIAFMPRKHADELLQVINILKHRGVLQNYQVMPIENKSEAQVAEILMDSFLFLSSGYPEGFSLSAAEAMACGCIVVGYHGMGGREFFREDLGYPISNGDVLAFARTAEKVIRLHEANPGAFAERLTNAVAFIRAQYSMEREKQDIVDFWQHLKNRRGS